MKYKINTKALPVFFQRVHTKPIDVSNANFVLTDKKITALHYHDVIEIGVCVNGGGQTQIGNRVYDYEQGHYQIVPSGIAHLSKANDKSRWIWVSFKVVDVFLQAGLTNPDGALSIASQENIICGVFTKKEYPPLARSIDKIIEVCTQKNIHSNLQRAFAIGDFLVECSLVKDKDAQFDCVNYNCSKSKKVNTIIDYVSENLDDNKKISEKALAERVGVSVATLRRLFLENSGVSPKTFILRSKMAVAEWLLTSSNLSITEIALRTGYSDVSGFNRVFKRCFNQTPIKYKKSI